MDTTTTAVPRPAVGVGVRRVRRRTTLLVLPLLAALAAGTYLVYTRVLAPTPPAPAIQQVAARRMSVVSSVSTTGTVTATSQARLAFGVAGKVKEVLVKVGDQVKAGQLLSTLDDSQLQIKLEQARSNLRIQQIKLDNLLAGTDSQEIVAARAALASAQANYQSALGKLAALQAGPSEADLQSAQSAVDSAQANLQSAQAKLDQLLAGPTDADIAAAEAAVVSARANLAASEQKLADLKAMPKPEDVRAAELALEQARNTLWAAQIDRDAACGRGSDDPSCKSAKVRVANAETGVSAAIAKLEQARQPASPEQLRAAEEAVAGARAGLTSAQARLDQLKAGPSPADLQAAQSAVDTAKANLASAQARLNQLLAGPTTDELRAARSAVDSARAGVESAQAKLDALLAGAKESDIALQREAVRQAELAVRQAEMDVQNASLVAPFDGVVTAINANVGEQVGSGGAAITIVDPRAIRVDAQVDESDIARITVGKVADITFDAVPGRRFRGTVTSIAPQGTTQQGVVTYPVILSIEGGDVFLPAGLTASINIIIDQKDNALVVPNRAVRRQGRDQVVEVVKDGKTEMRRVRTGVSNEQFTEILEGLDEGDQVVIPSTTTAPPRVGGGFGLGAGGPATFQAPVPKPGR